MMGKFDQKMTNLQEMSMKFGKKMTNSQEISMKFDKRMTNSYEMSMKFGKKMTNSYEIQLKFVDKIDKKLDSNKFKCHCDCQTQHKQQVEITFDCSEGVWSVRLGINFESLSNTLKQKRN